MRFGAVNLGSVLCVLSTSTLTLFFLPCCWECCYKTTCRVQNLSSESSSRKCTELKKSQSNVRHLTKWLPTVNVKQIGKENHASGLKLRFSPKPLILCLPVVGFLKYTQRLNIGRCQKCDLWTRGTRGCTNNIEINASGLWNPKLFVWKDLA